MTDLPDTLRAWRLLDPGGPAVVAPGPPTTHTDGRRT
jgi:hypothetical protein